MAAVLLLGAGAAVAATDPFGFWRSSSSGTAMFAVDPGRHVRTPTAHAIACPSTSGGYFRCGPQLRGRRYRFIDQISAINLTPFTRATLQRSLAQGERLIEQVFGRPLTADENRVLRDLLATATTQTSSSSSSPSSVAPAAPPRARRK